MTQTAVAERREGQVELHPATDGATLMAVISRAASDPAVDIDKMERLMQMHERLTERAAKAAYAAALADMQPKLPVIERKGLIEVRKKDAAGERNGAIQQSTPYALWEDINEAIRPLLAEHGFALSFRIGKNEDRVEVTGVLSHREGHSEETMLSLPMDTTGSKNNVQAIGSSTSYGKRYTAMALLNITTRGEDDDGKAAGIGAVITDAQREELDKLLDETGTTETRFLAYFNIEYLADMPVTKFAEAKRMLEQKRK